MLTRTLFMIWGIALPASAWGQSVMLMSAGPESPLARTSPGIPRAATPGMVDPMPHVPRPGAAPDARMLMNPR